MQNPNQHDGTDTSIGHAGGDPVKSSGELVHATVLDQHGKAYRQKDELNKRVKNYVRKLFPHESRMMVFLTVLITFSTISQTVISCNNSRSSADQFNQMKSVADRMEWAAHSFAGSADNMNHGIGNAAAQLKVQADKMDAARSASEQASTKALQVAIDNARRDQRAYVVPVDTNLKAGGYGLLKISLRNYGRVSAKNVEFTGTLDRVSASTNPAIQEVIPLHLPIAAKVIPSDSPTFTWDVFTPNFGSHFPTAADALRVLGELRYDDGFGNTDTAGICYVFQSVSNQWELCGGDSTSYVKRLSAN